MRSPSLAFGNKRAVGLVLHKTIVFRCPVGEFTAFRNPVQAVISLRERNREPLIQPNHQWTGMPTIRPVAGVGRLLSWSFFSRR